MTLFFAILAPLQSEAATSAADCAASDLRLVWEIEFAGEHAIASPDVSRTVVDAMMRARALCREGCFAEALELSETIDPGFPTALLK